MTPEEHTTREQELDANPERVRVSINHELTLWPIGDSPEAAMEFITDDLIGRTGWLEIDSFSVPIKIVR